MTYKQYRRTNIAEMTPWRPGMDMRDVSISPADRMAGSPMQGDMIARNPSDYDDRWLVAKAYFNDNFAEMGPTTLVPVQVVIDRIGRQFQRAMPVGLDIEVRSEHIVPGVVSYSFGEQS